MTTTLPGKAQEILEELVSIRQHDAPTHGGKVLSYVYDSGNAVLDDLAAAASREVQSLNGLDPTVFPSIAIMEQQLLGFAREMLHGDDTVFGNVTSGGTESCLLAVKTARDLWRAQHPELGPHAVARIVAPATVHAATHKAAAYFDLELDLVPVDPQTGAVSAHDLIERLGQDVALVVLSAPNYPYAQIDPIEQVAPEASARGIAVHVDACIGGFALPWWEGLEAKWDFAVEGVTSISADLHKYGYAPKGSSILLHRGADRHRAQYFAMIGWAGYPVVNPTMLGSKSAAPIASAWAVAKYLGSTGYAELTARMEKATAELIEGFSRIEGIRVQGSPTGPLFALVADQDVPVDRQVDPHVLVDELRGSGWVLQSQPGTLQTDGSYLPPSAHLTITPVIEGQTDELLLASRTAADTVRGRGNAGGNEHVQQQIELLVAALQEQGIDVVNGKGVMIPQAVVSQLLGALGVDPASGSLPSDMSGLLALAQELPNVIAQRLLVEILALVVTPTPGLIR